MLGKCASKLIFAVVRAVDFFIFFIDYRTRNNSYSSETDE